jgi:hypothetical protein
LKFPDWTFAISPAYRTQPTRAVRRRLTCFPWVLPLGERQFPGDRRMSCPR